MNSDVVATCIYSQLNATVMTLTVPCMLARVWGWFCNCRPQSITVLDLSDSAPFFNYQYVYTYCSCRIAPEGLIPRQVH